MSFHVFSMFSWTCFHVFSMCFPCVFHVFAMFSEPSCCKKHPQGLAELTLQPAALALPARSPRPRSTRRPGTNWGRSSSKKGMPQLVVSTMWKTDCYRTKFDTIWIYFYIWILGVYM
jgi:hypothetical protein